MVFEQGFPAGLPVLEPLGDTPSEGARTLFPPLPAAAARTSRASRTGVFPQLKPYRRRLRADAPGRRAARHLRQCRPVEPAADDDLLAASTPKAQHAASAPGWFGAGVKAAAGAVPKGWTQSWILSATRGVNAAFQAWGDRVLARREDGARDLYRDVTHSTIGFWTDNGGYYHYSTGTGSTKFPNGSYIYNQSYEEVLPKVKKSHDAAGVPFGHWQFDSWFYPKDATVGPGGGGGGVTNWTADPRIFPSGMAAINKALDGMPMVMHNRQWSPNSDYIKNLAFTWQTGPKWAIPDDPAAFFTWFFTTQQQGWGLTMYEQDWMCTEYDGVGALQSNVSLADVWLEGMAAGAAAGGLAVQYCMPYAHDILSGASHAAVTNARASDDYFHAAGHRNWAIGGTAMFYWGLGILPFKDGFYSSNLPQVGGQTVGPENDPDREALMATLSGAMVGPMDGIGLLNATRTMQSCRSDGVIPKPDVPVTTDDWCFGHTDPGCLVYSTSEIGVRPRHPLTRRRALRAELHRDHGGARRRRVVRLVQRQVRPHPGRVVGGRGLRGPHVRRRPSGGERGGAARRSRQVRAGVVEALHQGGRKQRVPPPRDGGREGRDGLRLRRLQRRRQVGCAGLPARQLHRHDDDARPARRRCRQSRGGRGRGRSRG